MEYIYITLIDQPNKAIVARKSSTNPSKYDGLGYPLMPVDLAEKLADAMNAHHETVVVMEQIIALI